MHGPSRTLCSYGFSSATLQDYKLQLQVAPTRTLWAAQTLRQGVSAMSLRHLVSRQLLYKSGTCARIFAVSQYTRKKCFPARGSGHLGPVQIIQIQPAQKQQKIKYVKMATWLQTRARTRFWLKNAVGLRCQHGLYKHGKHAQQRQCQGLRPGT